MTVYVSSGLWDLMVSVTVWDSNDRQWENQDKNENLGDKAGIRPAREPMPRVPVLGKQGRRVESSRLPGLQGKPLFPKELKPK